MQKYNVIQYTVSNILNWIQSGEIAVPEIQRPFVWDSTKVRDLMDSLYKGYPIGYFIIWKNPNVRLKNGGHSEGKKILIDGQQRVTALCAAVLGQKVVNKEYKEININISFNPLTEEFQTKTPAIEKDTHWIPDISEFLNREGGKIAFINEYCERNNITEREQIEVNMDKLADIKTRSIGLIELEHDLDMDTVTEIFIRVNSKGVVLSQADFAMSKIASHGDYGANLRKLIDYFCHLSIEPDYYKNISENDKEFAKTKYLSQIEWLKKVKDDIYDPDLSDVIRVSFTKNFGRGKISDLVSLLSGRNFETRTFEQSIIDSTFKKLEDGLLEYMNQTNFERFVMIIKSAGFISKSLINSQNALNMAYVVYLKLMDKKAKKDGSNKFIDRLVRKWFVMSVLRGRYSGSAESTIDNDIRNINKYGIEKYLQQIEETELSDSFWDVALMEELNKSLITNPFSSVFFAAQIYDNNKGFLSDTITVRSMIEDRGDIHHIFPKDYLMKKYPSKNDYNQIANFVYAQTEVNIRIGNKPPKEYFKSVLAQCNGGKISFGSIQDLNGLKKNLRNHCIPESIYEMTIDDYQDFLEQRRRLMAKRIENYYKKL